MRRETVLSALGAGTLAGVTGRLLGSERTVVTACAAVGVVSGAISGSNRMYDWKSARGRAAFVLDHTWALATTTVGSLAWLVNHLLPDSGFERHLSERRNRLVFRRGVVVRRGFAVTLGYVVNGAGGRAGVITQSRLNLVDRHEDVHVWQARAFGPLYALGYAVWSAAGAIAAIVSWPLDRGGSMATRIDSFAYYCNPFEWHAYTRDDNWPPSSADARLVWRRRFDAVFGRELRDSSGSREERR